MKKGIILIFFIFFLQATTEGQTFDAAVVKDRMTIQGKECRGYSTDFDFVTNRVEKDWWKYTRKFARPLNMKTYYKVTIPSSENSGNIDLTLYSKTLKTSSATKFFLCLEMADIPKENQDRYNSQVKLILQDFKKRLYLHEYEERLRELEKEAKKVSRAIKRKNKKSDVEKLIKLESKISEVKFYLQEIYNVWR